MRRRSIFAGLVVVALLLLPGCLFKRAPVTTSAAEPAETTSPEATKATTAAPEAGTVSETATNDRLIDENARLQLRIVESDSRVRHLEQQLTALQSRLDDAIQAVVRTKAKLRSVESRAEAASAMAETEIALKAATEQAGPSGTPELSQAEELLHMGTAEFRQQNYGGALYLTSQAKYQIRNVAARLDSEEKIGRAKGEQAFALPLALRVTARSNVREGPGTEFDVLATLSPDAAVTGYSHKGEWIRVEGAEGAVGWIHYELVSQR